MPNFERGKDPKESLQIGVEWKSLIVDHIYIKIMDLRILDDRTPEERHPHISGFSSLRPNPQQVGRKRLNAPEIHRFLQMTSEKRLWMHIFEIFPEYEEEIRNNILKVHILVILNKDVNGIPGERGYPFRSIWKCQGETLMFQKKLYSIPGGLK